MAGRSKSFLKALRKKHKLGEFAPKVRPKKTRRSGGKTRSTKSRFGL